MCTPVLLQDLCDCAKIPVGKLSFKPYLFKIIFNILIAIFNLEN